MANAIGTFEDGRRIGSIGTNRGQFLDHGQKRIEVMRSNAWHVGAQEEGERWRTTLERNPESFERAQLRSFAGDEGFGQSEVRERITTNDAGNEHEVVQRPYGVHKQRAAVPNSQRFVAAKAGRLSPGKDEAFDLANC